MALKGSQITQLRDAFKEAFRTRSSLDMLVSGRMEWELNEIAPESDNITETTWKLLKYADARGQMQQLMAAARLENEGSPELLAVAAELDRWIEDAMATEEASPIPAARSNGAGDGIREIRHDVFLAFAEQSGDPLPAAIANALATSGISSFQAPTAMFAASAAHFTTLEQGIIAAHAAMAILSPTLLAKMDEQPAQSRRILEIMQSRTGDIVALCPDADSQTRAAAWGFAATILLPAWKPESEAMPTAWIADAKRIIDGRRLAHARFTGLPFVVLAMTGEEAEELLAAAAADPEDSKFEQFLKAKSALEAMGVGDLAARYGARREDWKPFVGSDCTVRQLIDQTVAWINDRQLPAEFENRRIKAQLYPIDPLVNDERELRPLYQEIARSGCIVIVDELTLFSEQVINEFVQSPIDADLPAVTWVTISPFNPEIQGPRQLLEQKLDERLRGAFHRFNEELDAQCEVGVGDARRLKRWLRGSLPQTVGALLHKPPDNRRTELFHAEVLGDQHRRGADVTDFLGRQ